jgi:hypothetical protein
MKLFSKETIGPICGIIFGIIFLAVAAIGPANAQVSRDMVAVGPVISASSGDVVAGVTTATLPAPTTTASTWYVTGLEVTGNQATAAASVVCTITGLLNGTMTIDFPVTVIATPLAMPVINWPGGLAANPGTAVVFSCPSMGSGNLHSAISLHGVLVR